MAGTKSPNAVLTFRIVIMRKTPLLMIQSVAHPPEKQTKDCAINGKAERKPLDLISKL